MCKYTYFEIYKVFNLNGYCDNVYTTLEDKMVIALTLVFPDWEKQFHVDLDVSHIAFGTILVQSEGEINHLVYFASSK